MKTNPLQAHRQLVRILIAAAGALATLAVSADHGNGPLRGNLASPVRTTAPLPSTNSAPQVRVIGVLRSADPWQSRAILQRSGAPEAEYAQGEVLVGKWSLRLIDGDSVEISDGARVVRVPVAGGDAHPAVRQSMPNAAESQPSSAFAAPPAPGNTRVLLDAARRRAIHAMRTD